LHSPAWLLDTELSPTYRLSRSGSELPIACSLIATAYCRSNRLTIFDNFFFQFAKRAID
jgi:hypothetical protein